MSKIIPSHAMDSVYRLLADKTTKEVEDFRVQIHVDRINKGDSAKDTTIWFHLDYQCNHHLWKQGEITAQEWCDRTQCALTSFPFSE